MLSTAPLPASRHGAPCRTGVIPSLVDANLSSRGRCGNSERQDTGLATYGFWSPGRGIKLCNSKPACQAEATHPRMELNRTAKQRDRLLGRDPRPPRVGSTQERPERDQDCSC